MPLASVEEAIVFDDAHDPHLRGARGHDPARRDAADRAPREALPARGLAPGVWINETATTPKPPEVRPGRKAEELLSSSRRVGDRRVGFVVDRLVGQQDIVIKALGQVAQEGARARRRDRARRSARRARARRRRAHQRGARELAGGPHRRRARRPRARRSPRPTCAATEASREGARLASRRRALGDCSAPTSSASAPSTSPSCSAPRRTPSRSATSSRS